VDSAGFYSFIDGRDEALSCSNRSWFVRAFERGPHPLEIILNRCSCSAVAGSAGNGLPCAFCCGFGIGHMKERDEDEAGKRIGRIAGAGGLSMRQSQLGSGCEFFRFNLGFSGCESQEFYSVLVSFSGWGVRETGCTR
jgi:hypothetical protein